MPDAEARIGAPVTGYRIETPLGRGGMSVVYLAEDLRLHRRVALKILAPELAADGRFRARFLHESELAASIDHPNIVPIYEAGETDGSLFIAMRYVEGSDLRALLREQGALEPARAIALAEQIADALDEAHTRGLVHRDVKPSNVLLDAREHCYLADFGLTLRARDRGARPIGDTEIGTVDYAAPEQLRGETVTSSADVYSFACLLFECLTGEVPFPHGSEVAVIYAQLEEPPPRASERSSLLPPALDGALERGMAKCAEDRFATCRELVEAARDALGLQAIPPARRGINWRGWPAIATLACLGVALTALGAGFVRSTMPHYLARLEPNALGAIATDAARIESQVRLDSGESAIASGGEALWLASSSEHTVSRVDADSGQVRTLTLSGRPGGVAYGAHSLWATNSEKGLLVQIDPKTLKLVETYRVGNGPGAVALGYGAVWVVNEVGGTVSRLDLSRGSVTQVTRVGPNPTGVAVGAGAAWVSSAGSGRVLRLDRRTGAVAASIPVGNGPAGIAVSGNAVWVANRLDGTVSRIDPARNRVVDDISVGGAPTIIAAGPSAVWVSGGDEAIRRIDTHDDRVTDTIDSGSRPSGLALGQHKLWTTTLPAFSGHRGGVLRVVTVPGACGCSDPSLAFPIPGPFAGLVYDGLVAYRRVAGPAGSQLVPDLAVSLPHPSDAGRSYRFTLRRGIRYSTGELVLASDFRLAFERVFMLNRDPSVPPTYTGIVGARACRQGGRCDLSRGIQVDDRARTVTFHLSRPDPEFLYKLTHIETSPVPAATPLRPTPSTPVPGTGPYRVASFHPARSIRLDRNPRFHVWSADARPAAYPDEIRLHLNTNEAANLRAVEAGAADWVDLDSPSMLAQVQGGARAQYANRLHIDASAQTLFAFLNTRTPPFDDVRVRHALNLAIDRRKMVELTGGLLVPSCQILPPGFPGYEPYCPYTRRPSPDGTWKAPDLARARALVAASGTAGMPVTYVTPDAPLPRNIARYVASVLRKLGYRSHVLVPPPVNEGYASLSGNRAQLGSQGWGADALVASNFFTPILSCASFIPNSKQNPNLSEFCDPDVDAKMTRATALEVSDPVGAGELWTEIDHTLTDQAVVLPWGSPSHRVLVSVRVGNYQSHVLWGTLLDQLWVR